MSGIAGIFNRAGRPVERDDLNRMLASIAHRGPYGTGVWTNGAIGFGHCLLHTTPESLQEKLPLTLEHLTITCDARIDNREELVTVLDFKGRPLSEITDSEMILASYERWGEGCVDKLLGDFAFAIWDVREQKLFCARDHFGCKPFIYYCSERIFAFASDVKALLELPGVPRSLNEGRIADYLVDDLEGIDKTSTLYQNIFRLAATTTIVVNKVQIKARQYWQPDPEREIKYKAEGDYLEAFQEVFATSVRCRLRTADKVGSMLSGGLDSASIVCMGRELLLQDGKDEKLLTFSAVSDDEKSCVEGSYLDTVLAKGHLNAHKIRANQLSAHVPALEQFLYHSDDLFDESSTNIPLIAYSAARQQKCHVLLDGVDGLVTSGDNSYLIELLRAGRIFSFAKEAAGNVTYQKPYYRQHVRRPQLQLFLAYWLYPLLRAYLPVTGIRSRFAPGIASERHAEKLVAESIINPAFAARVSLADRVATMWQAQAPTANTSRGKHCAYLMVPFITAGLERYERLAASQSVESRHPFFDKRLVEFCAALPTIQKLSGGWTKAILRKAMSQIVPAAICWRVYAGVNLNSYFHFKLREHKRSLLKETMAEKLSDIGEFIDLKRLSSIWQQYQQDALLETSPQYAYNEGINRKWRLWQAVAFTLWLRRQA